MSEQIGDYKIVTGTAAEVLQEVNEDSVSPKDVLGFDANGESEVEILYLNSV